MKNEVKKKMMIERRKLSHQSHDERVFGSKSQEVFRRLHQVAPNFPSSITSSLMLKSPANDINRLALFQRGRWFGSLSSDAFFRRCIYNEGRKIFVGA